MRVFTTPEDDVYEEDRVNFVDESNVLLGYAIEERCCEFVGWNVLDTKPTAKWSLKKYEGSIEELNTAIEPYRFTKKISVIEHVGGGNWDDNVTRIVIAPIKAKRLPTKYVVLFNHHTGFYSHGFEFNDGETPIRVGAL